MFGRAGKHRQRSRLAGPIILSAVALAVMSSPEQRVPGLPPSVTDRIVPESGLTYEPRLPHGSLLTAEPNLPDGSPPTRNPASSPTQKPVLDPSPPLRVVIPTIGVDSPLINLGLNPDHTLEVPDDYRVAGWYIHSSVPGDPGPAIIAGHVDSYMGPGVFYSLALLRPGDDIVVEGKNGSIARFVVEMVEEYPKADFPTDSVYGRLSYPALRLITCGGAFNRDTRHYEDNVIVFARLAAGGSAN